MLQLLFNDYSDVKVPSPATLSRARRKIDLAMVLMRRAQWRDRGIGQCTVQLSFSGRKFVRHHGLKIPNGINHNYNILFWSLRDDKRPHRRCVLCKAHVGSMSVQC